jgi:hypothetical protein
VTSNAKKEDAAALLDGKVVDFDAELAGAGSPDRSMGYAEGAESRVRSEPASSFRWPCTGSQGRRAGRSSPLRTARSTRIPTKLRTAALV